MNRRSLIGIFSLTALLIAGCGVSEKAIQDGQAKVDALKAKGVPDSLLSQSKLYLRMASDGILHKNSSESSKGMNEFKKEIANVEKSASSVVSQMDSEISTVRSQVEAIKARLTGHQVFKLDSVMKVVDSLISVNNKADAVAKIKKVQNFLPVLVEDERKANEIKDKVFGTWTCTNVTKHSEDPTVNAVEKKIFILNRDGSAKFIEKKSGKSGPYLKEDYEYNSYGTFGFRGDTVYLSINRFVAVKQNFTRMTDVKKKVWTPDNHPSYDTTITDKSQDRFVAYQDLLADFERSK
ncbi:MAG: hypothetical protein ACM31E_01475 [Fibrobacterota bacterium]|nr:hypothetical protein [Chitinispirillaceae bacterium]